MSQPEVEWEPGTVCQECGHPLERHNVDFTETHVILECDDCSCSISNQYRSGVETVRFNPTAIEALGEEQGETSDG